jgi:hypothetical protein
MLYYSGHGSQMPDISKDETDGLDETIVPYDSRLPGKFDISDDELNALLKKLAAKTSNITVILDSCHSGTFSRGTSTIRRIEPDTRPPPDDADTVRQTTRDGASDVLELGANG